LFVFLTNLRVIENIYVTIHLRFCCWFEICVNTKSASIFEFWTIYCMSHNRNTNSKWQWHLYIVAYLHNNNYYQEKHKIKYRNQINLNIENKDLFPHCTQMATNHLMMAIW